MGGPRRGRSLGCGALTVSHLDISLRLLDSRSRELQRGQRELPSGQSLQFSPSALPLGHVAWLPAKKQARTEAMQGRLESGKTSCIYGKGDPWPKFLAKLSGRSTWKGKESISPVMRSFFPHNSTLSSVFSSENSRVLCHLNFPNANISRFSLVELVLLFSD